MAAPPLSNTFDGGTQGTALTQGVGGNTGGASGNFFDNVTIAADGTMTFDNTHTHSGGFAVKQTTVLSATSRFGWTGLGSITTDVWVRFYLYATANPSADWKICGIKTGTGAAASAQLSIDATGKLHVVNAAAGTLSIDSANAITLNQWVRIEFRVLSSTTVGQFEWWLYNTADAPLGSHTETKSATGAVLGADTGELRFGVASTSAPTNFTFWGDDYGVSSTAQLGPASSTIPHVVTFQPVPFMPQGRNL